MEVDKRLSYYTYFLCRKVNGVTQFRVGVLVFRVSIYHCPMWLNDVIMCDIFYSYSLHILTLIPVMSFSRCLSGHSHVYYSECECDWDCACGLTCECCEVLVSVLTWVWMRMWVRVCMLGYVGVCVSWAFWYKESLMCNLDTLSVKNCSVFTCAVQSGCTQCDACVCAWIGVWIGALIKHCRWGRSHGSGLFLMILERFSSRLLSANHIQRPVLYISQHFEKSYV